MKPRATTQPALQVIFTSASEALRVEATAEHLTSSTRGSIGDFEASRRVFWDEVQGVFTYEQMPWPLLVLCGFIAAGLLAVAVATLSVSTALSAILLGCAVVLAVYAYGRTRPNHRQWIVVVTPDLEIRFPGSNPALTAFVMAQLEFEPAAATVPPP